MTFGIVNVKRADGLERPNSTSAKATPPISPGRAVRRMAPTLGAKSRTTGPGATTHTATFENFSKGKCCMSKFARSVPSVLNDFAIKHTTVTASGSRGPAPPSPSAKAWRRPPAARRPSSGYGHALLSSSWHGTLGKCGAVPDAEPDSAWKWTSFPHPYDSILVVLLMGKSEPVFCTMTNAFVATSWATCLECCVRTSFWAKGPNHFEW
mmetsp:Transcript_3388/g.10185  ORF Transcript_3388/g.10185 Transcript_3388/m.10185 type:complete len:209 (-) Transcript_3388:1025-1651(-)